MLFIKGLSVFFLLLAQVNARDQDHFEKPEELDVTGTS